MCKRKPTSKGPEREKGETNGAERGREREIEGESEKRERERKEGGRERQTKAERQVDRSTNRVSL